MTRKSYARSRRTSLAIRAWERAGFERIEERPADEDHAAAWLLMEFRS